MTQDEVTLEQLWLEQKTLEESILSARKRIAEIREVTSLLSPKVEAARRQKEWIDGEAEREKLRATPEFQAWRKSFLEKEEQRIAILYGR